MYFDYWGNVIFYGIWPLYYSSPVYIQTSEHLDIRVEYNT